MKSPQRPQEIDGPHAELLQLEGQAGIAATMTRAREEPVGDIGEDGSSEEYLADAYRNIRRQTRDAYFSVQDQQLRKRLIASARQIERQRIERGRGLIAAIKPGHAQLEILDNYLKELTFSDQEERSGQRDQALDAESLLRSRAGESRRGRWTWERARESSAVRFVAIALIGLGGLLAYTFRYEAAAVLRGDQPAEALRPVTSLEGVRLGETLADVIARKGAFDGDPPVIPKAGPPDKENYVQRNGRIRIAVRKGLVTGISYECQGFDWTKINGVACHDPEERIRTVFGEARVLCAKVAKDDPANELAPFVKAFDVIEAGTRYVVTRNAVTGFVVMDARELESQVGGSFVWHECD